MASHSSKQQHRRSENDAGQQASKRIAQSRDEDHGAKDAEAVPPKSAIDQRFPRERKTKSRVSRKRPMALKTASSEVRSANGDSHGVCP